MGRTAMDRMGMMDRDAVNNALSDLRSWTDPSGDRLSAASRHEALARIADNIQKACAPGEPPVEGAIPLEGVNGETIWVSPAGGWDYTSTGAYIHWPNGVRTISAQATLVGRGVRVPEPPQPARQFERGDIVHDPIGDWACEVLAVDGDAAWIRRLDDGTRSVWNVGELRLVDTESTR